MRQHVNRLLRGWAGNAMRLVRRPRTPTPSPAILHAERQRWSIGIYRCAADAPLSFEPCPEVPNPVLTAADVQDLTAHSVADPFLMPVGKLWYMFFEVVDALTEKGAIALAISDDATHWNYQHTVLSEPFHLSYPYVFSWDGQYYMIPESWQAGSVRLYRAIDFPTRWSLAATLIDGTRFADSSIIHYRRKWWLFAAQGSSPFRADTLHLFHADRLGGPWRPHPRSPVVENDSRLARPAGRVLAMGDHILRYAQDCSQTYGRTVQAFEIVELTPTSYCERPCLQNPVFQPGAAGWNAEGMHHVDPHRREDGTWIACVDGCSLRPTEMAGRET